MRGIVLVLREPYRLFKRRREKKSDMQLKIYINRVVAPGYHDVIATLKVQATKKNNNNKS